MSQLVSADDYVVVQADSCRCVDERCDKEGENLGVQMPGCSQHIMDLFLVSLEKSNSEYSEELLWELTRSVYQSDHAQKHNLVMGMHIDDEHGELSSSDCQTRNAGCGYDKVRNQVLSRMGIEIDYQPGSRIDAARNASVGVQVLTGDHVAHATAAMNWMTSKTLQTQVLWEEGRNPSFNHDIWVVKEVLPEMIKALENKNHPQAAKTLEENALAWSRQLYAETLDILSNGGLTDASIIEIK